MPEYDRIKELERRLQQEFAHADEKVVLQSNSIRGINLKVVSSRFARMSSAERHQLVASHSVPQDELAFYELLTPEENSLFGTDLKNLEPENLPFWPEAVARGAQEVDSRFLDEDDNEPEKPFITTFYSVKGGVGRTTAFAYTARMLAELGYTVVTIDFDLEAPGLAAILGLKEMSKNLQNSGLVGCLARLETDLEIDIRKFLVRPFSKLELYYLPAGEISREYISQLRELNFERYYRLEKNPIHLLIDRIKETINPDVILIDARTGITSHNAPLLFDLSDLAILVFYPHAQTWEPLKILCQALLHTRNLRHFTPEIRFLLSPLPPSDLKDKKVLRKGLGWLQDNVIGLFAEQRNGNNLTDFRIDDITHSVPYSEALAFAEELLSESTIIENFRPVAEWVLKYLVPKNGERLEVKQILRVKNDLINDSAFRFDTGLAEQQEDIRQTFVQTEDYRKAIEPRTILIRGKKGSGKTLLFRYFFEKERSLNPLAITAPTGIADIESMIDSDGFRAIDASLKTYKQTWSLFWSFWILQRLQQPETRFQQSWIIDEFDKLCQRKNASIWAKDEFLRIGKLLEKTRTLLFDGLDAGFASAPEDLRRRSEAILGLFQLWQDVDGRLKNIQWKIFLREDIYTRVDFQNKSHLYGRELILAWDRVDYYKVILKQAACSDILRRYLQNLMGLAPKGQIDTLDESRVLQALHALVGERMKGSRSTFTRNWLWKRLADGKGDHSPRYLSQIFHSAWEKERKVFREETDKFSQVIIRPRMLIQSLSEVSHEAAKAIRDEYQIELTPLLDFLEGKVSPVSADELQRFKDAIPIALEAGVLSKYDEKDESQRYAVPDIYLAGLRMSRRGEL